MARIPGDQPGDTVRIRDPLQILVEKRFHDMVNKPEEFMIDNTETV
ncbi:unnamed protein product, partial [marine sediment metagenome]